MRAWYTLILIASKMPLQFHTILLSRLKGGTRFCESGVHIDIHDNRLKEGVAEVELFYHLQSVSLDDDVGLNVWFSRRWLVHHFCLFCADGLAQIVTGHCVFVNTVLHVGFGSSIQCKVFGLHLGLCLKPSEVEDRAVDVVSNVDSIPESLNASNSITENIILKRVGAKTHPCLTLFMTGKTMGLSSLSCSLACMPS